MAFETPISVADAVRNINERKYVLPAIQREFVWKPDQIVRLFDSLMKGYLIGSFLFWMVPAARTKDYAFYHFVQDYHERDARHNQKAVLTGASDITAVLDGQQRLKEGARFREPQPPQSPPAASKPAPVARGERS